MKELASFEDSEITLTDPLTAAAITGEDVPDYDAVASSIVPGKTIYFVGIGGISMSGLAEYACRTGSRCYGSDPSENARTAYLERIGVTVFHRHDASWIDQTRPDLVVYSSAVFDDNPERRRAAERGILCVNRSIFLGAVNRLYPRVINVSGTNGKTTTTAMCAMILMEAGLDPTVHLGAELLEFQSTFRISRSEKRNLLLSEACEYKRGFYHYTGTAAVILNIVHDHIDCYASIEDMIDAFARFAALQPEGSSLLLPSDDPNIPRMLRALDDIRPGHIDKLNLLWFGPKSAQIPCGSRTEFTYDITGYNKLGQPSFDLWNNGVPYASVTLSVIGEFNVRNAVAAAALADLCGASPEHVRAALWKFYGAEGRFTYTGQYNGARVYADYAHHPSSVRVTVEAARNLPARRLFVCFQPMTHSRAKGFFNDFVDALRNVRPVMISEIFDNREKDASISSKDLCERINALGGNAEYFPTNAMLEERLRALLQPGDVLLIMGGGSDILDVGDRLTERSDHMAPVPAG